MGISLSLLLQGDLKCVHLLHAGDNEVIGARLSSLWACRAPATQVQ